MTIWVIKRASDGMVIAMVNSSMEIKGPTTHQTLILCDKN